MKKLILILFFILAAIGTMLCQNATERTTNKIYTELSRTLTLTSSSVTTSGSVSSGAKTVILELSPDYTGTIDGMYETGTIKSLTFSAGVSGTLPAIAYVVTTGTITIRKLTP